MSETLLGTYALPQLQVYADADLYVLEPVARFVPGAMGAYDLSIQPSSYITTLYRHIDGRWYAQFLEVGGGGGAPPGAGASCGAGRRSGRALRS